MCSCFQSFSKLVEFPQHFLSILQIFSNQINERAADYRSIRSSLYNLFNVLGL